jgi:hypothetical protein
VNEAGWVDPDYLGIDQGPILAMIENYRSGLIWRVMRSNPYLRQGLERAEFSGGWLETRPAVEAYRPVLPLRDARGRIESLTRSRPEG